MNIPDPKTLTNVAKTLQNGGPENTLCDTCTPKELF